MLWEKHVSTETVFDGKLLKIAVDKVILPDGREAVRELVHHPGAVAILPVLEDGSIVFVKQYRYPLDSILYEIPAGKLEINEDPLKCATRELSEETGYSASKWSKLTTIATTPGFTDEIIHLYYKSARFVCFHPQFTIPVEQNNLCFNAAGQRQLCESITRL